MEPVDTVTGQDPPAGKVVEKGRQGPLVEEFRLVLKNIKLGKTREEALRAMSDRVQLTALTSFANALIQAERHELPFVIAPDERVIRLVGDIARQTVTIRHGQGLHQVPSGKIGDADVPDFAAADQLIQVGGK